MLKFFTRMSKAMALDEPVNMVEAEQRARKEAQACLRLLLRERKVRELLSRRDRAALRKRIEAAAAART